MDNPNADRFAASDYYVNRELSWLEFNQRVLMEAANPDNPVFERMKFLSIVSSNLDEFFMIRVASLRDQCNAGYKKPDAAGFTPKRQIALITQRTQQMVAQQYQILRQGVMPDLLRSGIRFLKHEQLSPEQLEWIQGYFEHEIYPVLTPMAVDSSRPFPLILNKSLNLGVLLASRDKERADPDFATVQVPSALPRIVELPCLRGEAERTFILMEEIIEHSISRLFDGRRVLCCHPYRITRNGDLSFDEEDAADLLFAIQKSLKKRKWGAVIRLEIAHDADNALVRFLRHALEASHDEVYRIDGPLNLDFLMKQVYGLPGFDHLKYKPFKAHIAQELLPEEGTLFDTIRAHDVFLHHPYDSFDPVVQFVQAAARDPQVMAIKQTLYRVSGNSPVVRALADAAEAGKQVTALLEIKARFDEENNIQWGKQLERAGCHVVYGLKGLKTHSKITLVVRKEAEGICRYVHLGTGNYNDVTARLYTDMAVMTADEEIGEDASAFFNMLTGYSETPQMHDLVYAPRLLRERLTELIDREAEHAKAGRPASITAKMNSLLDPEIIRSLYAASCAGVKIRLLVRGICCLRPGIKGASENIEVSSIVGRFLEHSRIFRFENDGNVEVYLSSADWMTRNLDRRVELMFPVKDRAIAAQVEDILFSSLSDNAKAWHMHSDGSYDRAPLAPGEEKRNIQEILIRRAERTWQEEP
ncbi:RNA degradosome polyphosphate kinase [Beduinella massiliensis]|uniref:RNA degradosome polyphosphate kinase n=1 Tax=Beduinella massiliensis TaxID=1852363 RepID=UPI000C826221